MAFSPCLSAYAGMSKVTFQFVTIFKEQALCLNPKAPGRSFGYISLKEKTMKKAKALVVPITKPRNTLAVLACKRRAGSHEKPHKSIRRATHQRRVEMD